MYVDKIEIQYFRSIYRETISGLKLLNVFTGKNDVGKSNVLKALNLFFNNEVDFHSDFIFSENFNFQRLKEVRSESIKGKQYIQIKVTFIRGNRFEKTLPEFFTVTKRWLRNDSFPSVVSDDLEKRLISEGKKYNDRSKSSLTAFLNRIKYIYIPAIKDHYTFSELLSQLREVIYNDARFQDKSVLDSMNLISKQTSEVAKELGEEFNTSTGISANLSTPKSISDLYQAISVETGVGDAVIDLDKRGDGIRIRFLPSVLYYIAKRSTNLYIWGFEEPENSLEYNLALRMANDFVQTYCKASMIFVTSHSPAFIGLNHENECMLYRCFKEGEKTRVIVIREGRENELLSEELGYIRIQEEIFSEYRARITEYEQVIIQKRKLQLEVDALTCPVLYTEGITDVLILEEAWRKLYGDQPRPFEIKSCNVLTEEDGSAAGCDVLKELLNTARPDSKQIIIGLFDRDKEGTRAFGLSNNFILKEDGWKTHKNGKAHALLLPVPPGKEDFSKFENLCIEFYFEKQDLDVQIDGKGLRLEPRVIVQTCNGVTISKTTPTEMYFHTIDKTTKKYFAETIVPSLPASSFVHFRLIFDKIASILE